jgi:ABC-type molybdate transport system substrate-binding protein
MRAFFRALLFCALVAPWSAACPQGAAPPTLKVYSAGSLKAAWQDLAAAYERKSGIRIEFEFGASGLLRERLAKGEAADLFTSADTGHPQALAQAGLALPMQVFAGNRLCVLARAKLHLTPDNLLDRLLDPAVRVGTSTPRADPAGDYTWLMFQRAELLQPGAFAALDAKALRLVGGPGAAPAPGGRSPYVTLMQHGAADLFVTYCTNALPALREMSGLEVVELPAALSVQASYGMVLMRTARPQAAGLRDFLLSPEGQAILVRHGFSSVATASP